MVVRQPCLVLFCKAAVNQVPALTIHCGNILSLTGRRTLKSLPVAMTPDTLNPEDGHKLLGPLPVPSPSQVMSSSGDCGEVEIGKVLNLSLGFTRL